MPSYLAVYEDTSPFFTYAGQWRAGRSSDDRSADQYSESSFTVTEATGASFSFKYYGTEVGIFGSKRGGHGAYQVSVDGVASPPMSGDARNPEFKASLFSSSMQKGFHNVTMVNSEDRFLDVDFVSWIASVGRDDEPLIVNTWQDSHPAFKYSPRDAWTTKPPSVGTFSGGDGHATSSIGASATLTFKGMYIHSSVLRFISGQRRTRSTGDAIAVYGPAGPDGPSTYSVQVNKDPPSTHSAFKQFYRPRQLLYYGANLGPGTHTITLKLDSTSNQSQMLAIDYAEIFTTKSLGGSFDGAPPSAPAGLIAGAVILGILSFVCLGVIAFFFVLYKKGRFDFAPTSGFNKGLEGGVDWRESTYQTYRPTDFVLPGQRAGGGVDDVDAMSSASPSSILPPSSHALLGSAVQSPATTLSRGLSQSDNYSIQTAPSMSSNPSRPPVFPTPSKRVLLALNEDPPSESGRVVSAPPPAYMS